jgi:hypothetical protein
MSVTIQCDGRIDISSNDHHLKIVHKNAEIMLCRARRCYDVSFTLDVSMRKPISRIFIEEIEVGTIYGRTAVYFEFPYELRKIALETFEDLVEVMNRLGLVDLASQRTE